MPCYNGAPHLKESMASALAQTYRHVELIVIDDGSTDSSPKILAEASDPRIRVLSQPNQGVCSARNAGLRAAHGEYIAFLDADDTWHPACLEELHRGLERNGEAALAYCGWQNLGLPAGRSDPFIPPDYERPDKLAILLEDCRWPIHAALTRHAAIAQGIEFDERFVTSEDFFFWLRIASRNRICLVPEVLAFYHHHPEPRATGDVYRMARNHWLVQNEFLKLNSDAVRMVGRQRIRDVTDGRLLHKAYACYWKRDLKAAQLLFRMVMKTRYGRLRDWLYMLPSVLPGSVYRFLIATVDRR